LTDALFGGFEGDWCDIPNEANQLKLAAAAPPFDKVDIITISHRHDDHFNPEMVISHLIRNPECTLICPKQVDSVLAL
jgi:L-ascorbate metabolism protein UlaG (beta-lactamase superfamily)